MHLLTEYGGWSNPKLIDYWKNYITAVYTRLKGKVKYYLTFNEVNNLQRMSFVAGGVLSKDPVFRDKPYDAPLKEKWLSVMDLFM